LVHKFEDEMKKEMKILLLKFSDDKLQFIKAILKNTCFRDSKYYESSDLEKVIYSIKSDDIELIICYGNPKNLIHVESYKDIIFRIPILFVTEAELDQNFDVSYLPEFPNYLPIAEVSSFTLEKAIFTSIERVQVNSKISELEQIQCNIEQKEKKFRDIFENSAIGIYEVDPKGNFILANKAFLNILGLKEDKELIDLNFFESGISTNGTGEKLRNLLKHKDQITDFEDEWLKSDKSKIIIRENIQAKKDFNGNIKFYQGVVEDITERKKVETELVRSKKDAEKSDRLKSEFLTQISHEIRTPVNTVLSFSTLIRDELEDSLSSDLNDCFNTMTNAGKRIIRTIDLLIKMSELHTENYEPEYNEHDLFELLENLLALHKPIADQKNLQLQFIKAVDSANIVFDKQTINDVFDNIIDNAIKYTSKGSVKIYVKKSLLNKISVTIIDTGIGISDKYIGNIFQPFSQETSGYTRKFDGNGLGLALVKEYCELNNAEIFVSSEKSSGSNFTVIFK